jgi:hypothetical protein
LAEPIWKWCGGGRAARGGALGGAMAVALCSERTRARPEVGEVVRARLFLLQADAVDIVMLHARAGEPRDSLLLTLVGYRAQLVLIQSLMASTDRAISTPHSS